MPSKPENRVSYSAQGKLSVTVYLDGADRERFEGVKASFGPVGVSAAQVGKLLILEALAARDAAAAKAVSS